MKNFTIFLMLIFIVSSPLLSQSLKNITNNKNVSLKKTIYLSDTVSNKTMKSYKTLKEKYGDYVSLSFGVMFSSDENPRFGSLDMNINLGFITGIFYLNMGIYGINARTKNYFGAHITPGLGINLFRNKIFTFAGAGYTIILPFSFYNASLRINYCFSEKLSCGLDNKLIFSKNPSESDIYTVGLNFSYRYNY